MRLRAALVTAAGAAITSTGAGSPRRRDRSCTGAGCGQLPRVHRALPPTRAEEEAGQGGSRAEQDAGQREAAERAAREADRQPAERFPGMSARVPIMSRTSRRPPSVPSGRHRRERTPCAQREAARKAAQRVDPSEAEALQLNRGTVGA
jgi:hypothetical protein